MPQLPEDFIHRIGRTARAGAEGSALSFIGGDDRSKWNAIQRLIDPNFKQDKNNRDRSGGDRRGGDRRGGGKSFDRRGSRGSDRFSDRKPASRFKRDDSRSDSRPASRFKRDDSRSSYGEKRDERKGSFSDRRSDSRPASRFKRDDNRSSYGKKSGKPSEFKKKPFKKLTKKSAF